MAKYVFGDAENVPQFVEPGDYVVVVDDVAFRVSNKGDDKIDLMLKVEGKGSRLYETLTFTEKAHWRIDTFVKCVGIEARKGQELDLTAEVLLGRRGWVTLKLEEYPVGSGQKKNKVLTWLTNKPKLARVELEPAGAADEGTPF